MAKKRILLALQVHNTQRLLVTFLSLGAVVLGTMYVFLFNSVAMRGYVLQQETEINSRLTIDKEKVFSKIAQYETQSFISEAPSAQFMVVPDIKNFAIIKADTLTAKK